MEERGGVSRVLLGGDPGLDGRIILRWIFRKWDVGAWIDRAHDRDMWRALVNAVMNLRVP
jgi:hypothetical protein